MASRGDIGCNISLTVDDGTASDTCQTTVTIADTQSAVVSCSATELNGHRLMVEYRAEDVCGEVTGSAVIETRCCPPPVVDGQIIKLQCGHHEECKLDVDFEHDMFKIKTGEALLVVTATDECGNTATCTLELCVPDDEDGEGDDGDDDD